MLTNRTDLGFHWRGARPETCQSDVSGELNDFLSGIRLFHDDGRWRQDPHGDCLGIFDGNGFRLDFSVP